MRYSGLKETLSEDVPLQSVDEILRARRASGLFDYLLNQFAQYSGVSGVQPKVLVRDPDKVSDGKARRSSSLRGATHIVKFWDEREQKRECLKETSTKANLKSGKYQLISTK